MTSFNSRLKASKKNHISGEKFQRYRAWNLTLKDYLLVSQDKPLVEHFQRRADGRWTMDESVGLETATVISSMACTLKLADTYDRTVFPDDDE